MSAGREFQRRQGLALKAHHGNPVHNLRLIRRYRHALAAVDHIPIYDKPDLPGFYMAIGTSGNQYKTPPVVGRMMAELIDTCEKGLDHDKEPFQYEYKYTKRTLNVGFFSRKRDINYESSFSVNG